MSYSRTYNRPVNLSGLWAAVVIVGAIAAVGTGLAGLHEYRYQRVMQQVEKLKKQFTMTPSEQKAYRKKVDDIDRDMRNKVEKALAGRNR